MTNKITKPLKAVSLMAVGAGLVLAWPTIISHIPIPKSMSGKPLETITEGAPVDLNAPSVPKAPSIRVSAVQEREIVESLSATGSIVPRTEAQIGADVSGLLVEQLYFDVGDTVKKGDRLARLDRTNLELQLAQISAQAIQNEANLAAAQSQTVDAEISVKQAQEQLDRVAPLVKSGVASKAQRDNAQNELASAKARLASASQNVLVVDSQKAVLAAQRKQTELQLQKTELVSPVDGLILTRNASIGQVVSGAGGALFTMATDSEFELAAEVAESDLARVAPEMAVAVTLPGRAEPLTGKIRLVSPQIDTRSRLGTVRVTLPFDPGLRNGTFARAIIELNRQKVVAIPMAAVLYRDRDPFVQKVVSGKIVSTSVTLGLRDNEFVGIDVGLNSGDEVVSRAGTFVSDGDAVTPIRDGEMVGAVKQ
jgi:HlyD family secretion protein